MSKRQIELLWDWGHSWQRVLLGQTHKGREEHDICEELQFPFPARAWSLRCEEGEKPRRESQGWHTGGALVKGVPGVMLEHLGIDVRFQNYVL